MCTLKISRYAADYRHLIAYEMNAHGWKKRLRLEGVGGGAHLKNCYCQAGGGGVQFSYVIILGGVSFDTPHFSVALKNGREPFSDFADSS